MCKKTNEICTSLTETLKEIKLKLINLTKKLKSNVCISYLIKLINKIRSKVHAKYFILTLIALIIAGIFLFPVDITILDNNQTMFTTLPGFQFQDHSPLVATILGIFAFFAAIYSVDMSYKSAKLAALPENSVDLLMDLDYYFRKYELNKPDDNDIILFFVEILRYWRKHQKALRLLCPKFYKRFLKFYSMPNQIKETERPEINSEYVIMAIKTQIANVALQGEYNDFFFIKPDLINDEDEIESIRESEDNYGKSELNRKSLESYIDNINGDTKEITKDKFNLLCEELDELLSILKNEIGNYDLL